MDNYGGYAGLGAGVIIFGIILYIGFFALAIWIGYLIQRTAVKNGMLRAMQESGMIFAPRPGAPYPGGGQPGAQPPYPGNAQPGAQPPYPGQAPQGGQPPRPGQPPLGGPPQTPPTND
ncbi:hypothetical protein [Microbacterium oleivorans]|uniref:hypothetical protein n=1 Tax=Microbacterium oleivorans TaxID=273677 RepID=UPI00080E6AE6|nr:hypothetical protein [Microbacterium oleivorans]